MRHYFVFIHWRIQHSIFLKAKPTFCNDVKTNYSKIIYCEQVGGFSIIKLKNRLLFDKNCTYIICNELILSSWIFATPINFPFFS